MFTRNKTQLQDMTKCLPILVVRDCSFSYAAKIPSFQADRIVACATESHLKNALNEAGIVGVITNRALADQVPDSLGLAISSQPYATMLAIHETLCAMAGFHWQDFKTEISPSAIVHPSAVIAEKNVRIGAFTIVHPNAVIAERVILGEFCSIGACSIVGATAFEVNTHVSPQRIVRQAGGVWLHDNVEIEAGCTIVRSTFGGFTRIGAETKLDCQVHLAHDCVVGERVSLAACAEVSGRVTIGNDSFVGPNVSISNGLKIGRNTHITIGSVVVRDIADGERVTGNFALPHRKWIAFIKSIR